MESSVDLIEPDRVCPSCAYNLHGLPGMYRCPECGFEYDPSAVVVRLHGKRIRGGDVRPIIAVLAAAFGVAIVVSGTGTPDLTASSLGRWMQWLLFVILGLGVVVRIARRAGGKQELRINHNGVQFVDPSLPRGIIPWDRIARAEYVEDRDALLIKGRTGETLRTCSRDLIGERSDVEFCAGQINMLREKYELQN